MAQPGRNPRTCASLAAAAVVAVLVSGCGGAGGANDDIVKGAGKLVLGSDDVERVVPKFESQFDTGGAVVGDDAARAGAAAAYYEDAAQAMSTAFCEGWDIARDYGGWPTADEWYDIAEDRMRAYHPSYGFLYRMVSSMQNFAAAVQSGNIDAASLEAACAAL